MLATVVSYRPIYSRDVFEKKLTRKTIGVFFLQAFISSRRSTDLPTARRLELCEVCSFPPLVVQQQLTLCPFPIPFTSAAIKDQTFDDGQSLRPAVSQQTLTPRVCELPFRKSYSQN